MWHHIHVYLSQACCICLMTSFPFIRMVVFSSIFIGSTNHLPPVMTEIISILVRASGGVTGLLPLLSAIARKTLVQTRFCMAVTFVILPFDVRSISPPFNLFFFVSLMVTLTRITSAFIPSFTVLLGACMVVYTPLFTMPLWATGHIFYFWTWSLCVMMWPQIPNSNWGMRSLLTSFINQVVIMMYIIIMLMFLLWPLSEAVLRVTETPFPV